MLKPTTVAAALLGGLLASPALAQEHAPTAMEGITWRTDLKAARKEATAAGKPMLVTFR